MQPHEQRTVMQLAVLASLTVISSFVVYGAYRKRQQQAAVAPAVQQAKADTQQKATEQKTPEKQVTGADDAAAAAALAAGQEAATAATTKYKAGDYAEAIRLYTEAIQLCESTPPVDHRNLKVMFSNRAAAYERLGDHAQVVNDCTNALVLDKRHPKSYLRRAKAKAAQSDLAGALVDYVCMLVISEEKNEQVDESLALEISRIHTEITTQQITDLQARKLNPQRYLPDQFFISSYYSSFHANDDQLDLVVDGSVQEYSDALEALATDASPSVRGELLTKRALALKAAKEYEAAALDFEAALALLKPTDAAFYAANVEGGTYYHLRGEFEVAQKCFEAALTIKPDSLFAKIRMGGLCFDRKELAEALEWFDKALADKATCATAYFHRGQLHSIDTEGETTEQSMALALQDLQKCTELAADFSMAYIQLGVTQARSGNFDKAVEYLQTAATITPDVPEIYNYLGETYMQMAQAGGPADLQRMEDMFDKALALDASYPMAYINKGNLLMQKGSEHGHEALDLFETAVKMCPRSKFAYCHLAQVYMAMQDYSRAIEQIDRAITYAFAPEELNELFAIRVTAETHQQAKVLLN